VTVRPAVVLGRLAHLGQVLSALERLRQMPAAARDYREIIPALCREGILPPDLSLRLEGLAGMRNILVHDYADVDPARIWAAVDQRLDDLRSAQAALANLPELGPQG
jgi:uncharacterized protein YutE (UPF0331/DUF86 family)